MGSEPPPVPCPYRDTTVTLYLRDKDGKVLAEYGQLWGVPRTKYVYAGDQRIAMYNSSGYLYFYLNDHLGSARVVVRASNGIVADKYYTSSFGAPTGQTVNLNQRYRYTGKPFDEDAGIDLYYYGARYYDPLLGRFLTVDPAASMYPSWSPYMYTMNNPLKYVDPDGKWTEKANARTFVKAALGYLGAKYGHDPSKGEVDCSQLVQNALADIVGQGVATGLQEAGELYAAGIDKMAASGEAGLERVDFDITTVEVGDLIITDQHVEIVTAVGSKGVSTVAASSGSKKVIQRGKKGQTFDPMKSSWFVYKSGDKAKVVKITEKKNTVRASSWEERWREIYDVSNN